MLIKMVFSRQSIGNLNLPENQTILQHHTYKPSSYTTKLRRQTQTHPDTIYYHLYLLMKARSKQVWPMTHIWQPQNVQRKNCVQTKNKCQELNLQGKFKPQLLYTNWKCIKSLTQYVNRLFAFALKPGVIVVFYGNLKMWTSE